MSADTFDEVADILFGGGYDQIVSKANPDGMDLSAARRKRERNQARVGLATNVIGIGAGVTGTAAAYKTLKATKKKSKKGKGEHIKPFKNLTRGGKLKALAIPATLVAGGGLALQGANLGGDVVANRVLSREAVKKPDYIHKDIKEIAENAAYPKKKLTEAAITSAGKAGGKGAEYVRSGKLKKLPNKIKTRQKVEKSVDPRLVAQDRMSDQEWNRRIAKNPAMQKKWGGKKRPISRGLAPVSKSDDLDLKWEGEISKVIEDKQQVFGWASIVEVNGEPVVDLQGDYISIDEVEKAGYEYVKKSRKGGDMHLRDGDRPVLASDMIESFIVTPEKKEAMKLPEETPSGWWVGFQVNDPEVWGKVKSGQRTGFSIHGRGQRSPA